MCKCCSVRDSLVAILIATAVLVPVSFAQKSEWNGVIILRTTRSEVEKRFGKPIGMSSDAAARYETEEVGLFVRYSVGKCPDANWNVPHQTVIGVTVAPKVRSRLQDLGIDIAKFEKKPEGEITFLTIYTNWKDGVRIQHDHESNQVETISYFPGTRDNSFSCKSRRGRTNTKGKRSLDSKSAIRNPKSPIEFTHSTSLRSASPRAARAVKKVAARPQKV